MLTKLLAVGALVGGAMTLCPRPAEACSAPRCWPGYFTPSDGTTVPANVPAIYWRPMQSFDSTPTDPSKVSLKTAAGVTIPLTATATANGDYLLVPDTELVAGTSYTLTDLNVCADDQLGPTASFTAGAAAPLPTTLGTLSAMDKAVEALEVATSSGSCSIEVQADQALISLALSAEATPWHDALHFETLVDGNRWSATPSINITNPPGSSASGRGSDRVFHTCATDDQGASEGVALGSHDVEMRATLPGTATTLTAAPVTIELSCSPDVGECLTAHGTCGDDGDGGGCSTSTKSSGAGAGLALGALLLRRRRR